MKKGFTLIELLIVVAIIAILAAIAVPNFLEAQTRSKVARAYADMRTLATALEEYSVDYNRYMPGWREAAKWNPRNFGLSGSEIIWGYLYSRLTTPVAYLSSIPVDKFAEQGSIRANEKVKRDEGLPKFSYQSIYSHTAQGVYMGDNYELASNKGVHFSLHSRGPSKRQQQGAGETGNFIECLAEVPSDSTAWKYPDLIYDPTNGTTSFGFLIRTNKGMMND